MGKTKNLTRQVKQTGDAVSHTEYKVPVITIDPESYEATELGESVDISEFLYFVQEYVTHYISGKFETHYQSDSGSWGCFVQGNMSEGFLLEGFVLTIDPNHTVEPKSQTLNISLVANGVEAISQFVVTQLAGYRTYSEIQASLSYDDAVTTQPSSSPTLTYSQTWGLERSHLRFWSDN